MPLRPFEGLVTRLSGLLLGALALASCAADAGKEAVAKPMLRHPHWVSMPTSNDLKRLYPPEAAQLRLSGRATIKCKINGEGRLNDCVVVEEEPAGKGFGSSTLALAPTFQMGDSNGGTIQVPVNWEYGWK